MWDAQEQYWYGYEWTKHLPGNTGQPTVKYGSSSNYAQSNTDPRYYKEGNASPRLDATQSCAGLPNANELSWYAAKGDPCWDKDELWTTMGHLYKGGMWFKKKAKISGFDNNTAVDGSDWRGNIRDEHWSASRTLPSAADAGNYFYLPALGNYGSGQLNNVGNYGFYWSSSAYPWYSDYAYRLYFYSGYVTVDYDYRYAGYRVGAFE